MKKWILVLGLLGSPVSAEIIAGKTLYEWCTGNDPGGLLTCGAFVFGVIDANREAADWAFVVSETESERATARSIRPYCFPEGVTGGQIRDIVGKYLQDTPEHRHQSAASLVKLAVTKAFPCH